MDRNFSKRMQEKLNELKNSDEPQPIRSDGAGALDLGPRNPERAGQQERLIIRLVMSDMFLLVISTMFKISEKKKSFF